MSRKVVFCMMSSLIAFALAFVSVMSAAVVIVVIDKKLVSYVVSSVLNASVLMCYVACVCFSVYCCITYFITEKKIFSVRSTYYTLRIMIFFDFGYNYYAVCKTFNKPHPKLFLKDQISLFKDIALSFVSLVGSIALFLCCKLASKKNSFTYSVDDSLLKLLKDIDVDLNTFNAYVEKAARDLKLKGHVAFSADAFEDCKAYYAPSTKSVVFSESRTKAKCIEATIKHELCHHAQSSNSFCAFLVKKTRFMNYWVRPGEVHARMFEHGQGIFYGLYAFKKIPAHKIKALKMYIIPFAFCLLAMLSYSSPPQPELTHADVSVVSYIVEGEVYTPSCKSPSEAMDNVYPDMSEIEKLSLFKSLNPWFEMGKSNYNYYSGVTLTTIAIK